MIFSTILRLVFILKILKEFKCDNNLNLNDTIIYPSIVNKYGILQTNDITNYKRYIQRNEIHYKFNHKNQSIFIDLVRNNNLVRNTISIKYSECQYKGVIKNHSSSLVAISVCNGLNGYILFENKLYVIESTNKIINSQLQHRIVLLKDNAGFTNIDRPVRLKRSTSKERQVETLVVADKSMFDFHKYDDLENYLLTIMNIVNSLYSHESLENVINFVVVRIVILEDEKQFKLETNATSLLTNFCKYQSIINYPDWHPIHHDFAILVTKIDVCADSNEPCDTLGIARLAGMCDPSLSCSVNEDNGLTLALTIAHEIGHSLNADHNSGDCQSEDKAYMMDSHLDLTTHLESDSEVFMWSKCSRNSISNFLDTHNVTCLDDNENIPLAVNLSILPGLAYDFDHQCRFSFNENASHCDHKQNECDVLWCKINNQESCLTKSEKPAEGTICGGKFENWCIQGKCVPIELNQDHKEINGNWGEWSAWSNCSRQCNSGIQFTERDCTNPRPSNGGKYCLGERKRYQVCNTHLCADRNYDNDFKNAQCARHTNSSTKNLKFYLIERDPCRLYCSPENNSYFTDMSGQMLVEDGTPCSESSNSLCLGGVCKNFGCDWIMDSNTKFDYCGVCGGDNSTCNILNGTVNFSTFKNGDYEPVVLLPANATNVRISKHVEGNSFSYLAIRDSKGTYYLNGDFQITSTGSYKFEDLSFDYVLNSREETITFHAPLKRILYIMLLNFQLKSTIYYQYALPNSYKIRDRLTYYWNYNEWSTCSKSCGKGTKQMDIKCFADNLGKVDDSFCLAASKPEPIIEMCNVFECAPEWLISEWQPCQNSWTQLFSTRKRSVSCVVYRPNRINDMTEIIGLPNIFCNATIRPIDFEECILDQNSYKEMDDSVAYWITENWNNNCETDLCARSDTRIVKCSDINAICDLNKRPISEKKCEPPKGVKCGTWSVEPWSNCSNEFPSAIRTRNVICVEGDLCSKTTKPHFQEMCRNLNSELTTDLSNQTLSRDLNDTLLSQNLTDSTSMDLENELISLSASEESSEIKKRSLTQEYYDFFSDNYATTNRSLFESNITEVNGINKSILNETSVDLDLNDNLVKSSDTDVEYDWKAGNFGSCSRQCGGGFRLRRVVCFKKDPHEQADETKCLPINRPESVEVCNIQRCLDWNVTEWTRCSKPCGNGFKTRQVSCDSTDTCDFDKFPLTKEVCNERPCFEWITDDWSQCSQTCGLGVKTRKVYCFNHLTNSSSDFCHQFSKPSNMEKCVVLKNCPYTTTTKFLDLHCQDKYSQSLCKLILFSNRCNEPRFKSHCCQTCSRTN